MKADKHPSLLESFHFAGAGLLTVVRTQRNFRIHLMVGACVVLLGLGLGLSLQQWAIIALAMVLVLTAEVFNTAAEALVDLASPDYHPLAKKVKDLAAGSVLLTAMAAVVVGLLILGPGVWERVHLWLNL